MTVGIRVSAWNAPEGGEVGWDENGKGMGAGESREAWARPQIQEATDRGNGRRTAVATTSAKAMVLRKAMALKNDGRGILAWESGRKRGLGLGKGRVPGDSAENGTSSASADLAMSMSSPSSPSATDSESKPASDADGGSRACEQEGEAVEVHRTMQEAVAFASAFYDLLAEYLPGDTTLNELRVLTAVAKASLPREEAEAEGGAETVAERGTSVTQIAADTGVSRTTVSRMISQWSEAGQIVESPHPEDGRRRILGFTEEAHRLNAEWSAKAKAILRDHVEAMGQG